VREECAACPELNAFTHVDALTLNIERACQAAIDMAMHRVAVSRLGMPQSAGEAFTLLERAGELPMDRAKAMRSMIGFRNIAVHQYQELDRGILTWVATKSEADFVAFGAALGVTIRP
jgi:uncharacterized protein YutE (UPF0331/DUF86 family)